MTAVLFDLDGTLVDGSDLPLAVRGVATLIAARVPGLDAADLVEANTAEWQDLWPEIEDDWMLGTLPGEQLNERAWRGTLGRCGVHDDALVARPRPPSASSSDASSGPTRTCGRPWQRSGPPDAASGW